jgi:hypothetical protein
MSRIRAIVSVATASAFLVIAGATARAQTCSISSTARGSVSCSVTSTVQMGLRIPALVGVTVTPVSGAVRAPGSAVGVRARLRVKTNRSYALQIASAPAIPGGRTSALRSSPGVIWATKAHHASLDETPTQIDAAGGPSDDREPLQVAFVGPAQSDVSSDVPIRLILTIVAP